MKYKLLLLLALGLLAGCPKTIYIYETRTEYATFDDVWLVPCAIVPPPPPEAYIGQTTEMQKLMWASKYFDQMGKTNLCNENLKAARTYNDGLKNRQPTVVTRQEEK